MHRVKNTRNMEKYHNDVFGKGGFTLVEISVVLALLTVLITMIVSFSVLMRGIVKENKAEYAFLEDYDYLRDTFDARLAEIDADGTRIAVCDDELVCISKAGERTSIAFSEGRLIVGDIERRALESVDRISFETNGKLIKCSVFDVSEGENESEKISFVLSVRCSEIVKGGNNGE